MWSGVLSRTLFLAAALLLSSVGPPVLADRRDQKAADLFNDAVAEIRAKKYRPAIVKLNEALSRGATEPNDEQGSRSRFYARRYDPYYWLGVAHMELGDDARALGNFEKSLSTIPADRKEPLVKGWKEEYGDLQARMALLLKRMEASPAPPARLPAPTLVAVAPPAAPPTAIVVAQAPPTAAPAAPAAQAGAASALAADEKRTFRAEVAPALRTAALGAALDAYGRQDWRLMEVHVARARAVDPGAPQADVLECAARLTRFVLGGRRDQGELRSARELFLGWRAKVGARRDLPGILSPSMRTLLGAA